MGNLSRRCFLAKGLTAVTLCAGSGPLLAPPPKTWRAAIIGATGQGDYGHGLDLAFSGIDTVTVVGLADANDSTRNTAARRARALREYADYRDMLTQERPELVVIAPRWSDRHFEMTAAALEAGAHVLTEKPFTVSLAEADDLLATAQRRGLTIAVAHQMRLAPSITHLHRRVRDGLLGEIVQMRSWGKQDTRAGGEDMLVLGTHIFDMMRMFAGDAISCSARVFSRGRPITSLDGRLASERIGPVAGDEIEAEFEFLEDIIATFTSRGRLRETFGPWALELIGSKGVVRVLMDIDPVVLQRRRTHNRSAPAITDEWVPLTDDPTLRHTADQRGFVPANRRVVLDWLTAIEQGREPQCGGHNGMKALEFLMATWWSALGHHRVQLPLSQRQHPF